MKNKINIFVSTIILTIIIFAISTYVQKKLIKYEATISCLVLNNDINENELADKSKFKTAQIPISIDTKENLSIYEAETGKEKISIKIKTAENGMSFQIKEGSIINVYATIRTDLAKEFLIDKERMTIGDEIDGYTIIKILSNVKVLGTFTIDGIEFSESTGENIDSVLISVTPEEAKEVNLIREIATFNITSGINQNISGDKV